MLFVRSALRLHAVHYPTAIFYMILQMFKYSCLFSLALLIACSKTKDKQEITSKLENTQSITTKADIPKSTINSWDSIPFDFSMHRPNFKLYKPSLLSLDSLNLQIKSQTLIPIDSTLYLSFLQRDSLIAREGWVDRHYYYALLDTSKEIISLIVGSLLHEYSLEYRLFTFSRQGALIDVSALLLDFADGGSACTSRGSFINDSLFQAVWIQSFDTMNGDTIIVDSSNVQFHIQPDGLIRKQRETISYSYPVQTK